MYDPFLEMFENAIEQFPIGIQPQAREWLTRRDAAFRVVSELESRVLAALSDDDSATISK
jgi:hypothetical protein